nr:type II toxin-antitoxin system RelE/ParE family toxin [uncultured Lacibacter sp.]
MAYEVVWTLLAEDDYKQIISYLKNEWGESVAANFIETTEERIERVAVFPFLGVASQKDNSIRSIVLTKHNKLYYRFFNSKVYILSIFDTRQHPGKNKF